MAATNKNNNNNNNKVVLRNKELLAIILLLSVSLNLAPFSSVIKLQLIIFLCPIS